MTTSVSAPLEEATDTIQFVFRVEGQGFALPVDIVNEILDPQPPTPVPNANNFAPGVVNVRGVVVPVVNIRLRLGMPEQRDLDTSRMIVIEMEFDGEKAKLAFIADAVEQVVEADMNALEKVPDLGALWPQVFLRGAFRKGDDVIVVLEPNALFSPTAPHQLEAA